MTPGDVIERDGQLLRLVTRLGGGKRRGSTGSGKWHAVPVREAGVDEEGKTVYEQIGIKTVEVDPCQNSISK